MKTDHTIDNLDYKFAFLPSSSVIRHWCVWPNLKFLEENFSLAQCKSGIHPTCFLLCRNTAVCIGSFPENLCSLRNCVWKSLPYCPSKYSSWGSRMRVYMSYLIYSQCGKTRMSLRSVSQFPFPLPDSQIKDMYSCLFFFDNFKGKAVHRSAGNRIISEEISVWEKCSEHLGKGYEG